MTYSDKYALMKSYKIITGDDPDQNPSEEGYKRKQIPNGITEIESKSIYALMVRKGYDVVPTLEKNYGIKNTADLTKEQYIAILNKCNTMPDKK